KPFGCGAFGHGSFSPPKPGLGISQRRSRKNASVSSCPEARRGRRVMRGSTRASWSPTLPM
ncbi:hypothetical protein HPB47_009606, partial [Ixodes persulcatus]